MYHLHHIRDINISNYILAASNYFGDLIVSKSPWIVTNSNIYYSSNVNITGQLYIEGDLNVTGYVLAGGPVSGNHFSDDRLKNQTSNIRNPIDLISKLNGFHYIPNDLAQQYGFKERNDIGLSAQEVQNIIPEAVEKFGNNSVTLGETIIENPLRVNEKMIIPVLVKAIQELNTKFEEYKATHP